MKKCLLFALAAALAACGGSSNQATTTPDASTTNPPDSGTVAVNPDAGTDAGTDQVKTDSAALIDEGRETFRHETYGDEAFWSNTIHLNAGIAGTANGGGPDAGAGLSPNLALAAGLKVDIDAVPPSVLAGVADKSISLDDPAITLALIGLDAVVGVKQITAGNATTPPVIGVTCALCHSTVDNSSGIAGIGHRLDGWPNRDLNVGAVINVATDLSAVDAALGNLPDTTVRGVLNSWGPGKFDAELFLDGKPVNTSVTPNTSAATLIPPAFGLQGVNLHTWTGWGSIPYWNAFVAVLEMHGQGNFFDSRLDNATQFPLAAANNLGHHTLPAGTPDLVTPKLGALHYYQLSLLAPPAPAGSFDATAATAGQTLFNGAAKCASCHMAPLYTEPGWNMHTGAEVGIDEFQASRAPDNRYRTSPLKGLWTHTKGGFYHDGRFADLPAVVAHYNTALSLGLSTADQTNLVEYLKSL
jgi:hypothetical protein